MDGEYTGSRGGRYRKACSRVAWQARVHRREEAPGTGDVAGAGTGRMRKKNFCFKLLMFYNYRTKVERNSFICKSRPKMFRRRRRFPVNRRLRTFAGTRPPLEEYL
jgi:hypothetical protein